MIFRGGIMHIGNKIKIVRKANKLTQIEFAKKLKISRSSLIYYEKGERTPPVDLLLNISKLFNVSMGNLVDKSSDYSVSKEEMESLSESGLVQSYEVSQKSSEEILLSNFKMFLEVSGFPVGIMSDEDIKVIHKNTLSSIEFEVFKAGYIKVVDNK
jgi:transcriptional regulator with XRE-family HTH domain